MDYFQNVPAQLCTTKAGMAAGTTTTLTTANTQIFSLRGKAYSKAGTSNEATPTTDAVTGAAFLPISAGYGSVFVICRDSSGNLKVVQGQVAALDASNKFIVAPYFPPIPDALCPIGYITVLAGTGATTWTFGSSNLAGPPSNVVINYVDCFTLPDRLQVA